MSTGLVCHEKYMWHDTGHAGIFIPAVGYVQPAEHAESPESKRRIRNLLEVSGLIEQLVPIRPRIATRDEVLRYHTAAYIDRIAALSNERGGDAGMTTPFAAGGFDIALLSAGGVIAAAEAVVDGTVDNAYALVRPPGHHAEADMGKGFCLLANAVLGIRHVQATRGVERVAVVDYDVHHGNGTQNAFYENPDVLTISIHQDNCFPPNSGAIGDIGAGRGQGYNINVPLPPGSGQGAYRAVMERVVVPAVTAFRPDLIVVPSGFDAGGFDPLGRMMLSSSTYREIAATLKGLAGDLCAGRLLFTHEGGYSAVHVPFCAQAVIEELCDAKDRIEDPFEPILSGMGGHQLYPHQDQVISAAAKLAAKVK
ncbi:MAG: class II histone deacetylase [Rhodobacteraceae bacterium]|nr:class II histone deacetylase [Paracoccaceae bacterium]MCP5342966.1 class II histone deacetylase [Paracoccaceae bacterium]